MYGFFIIKFLATMITLKELFPRELGKLRSHIELSCKKLTAEEMNCIEKTANEIIRNSTPVIVHVHPSATCPELKNVSEGVLIMFMLSK